MRAYLWIVDMAKMLRRMIGAVIELATTLAAGLSHVRADPSQLEQVVMNLVISAVHRLRALRTHDCRQRRRLPRKAVLG